jgi:hypothetical protein
VWEFSFVFSFRCPMVPRRIHVAVPATVLCRIMEVVMVSEGGCNCNFELLRNLGLAFGQPESKSGLI